jgi:hypothetical protein
MSAAADPVTTDPGGEWEPYKWPAWRDTGREERKKEREKNRRKGERKKRKRKEKKKMKEKGGKGERKKRKLGKKKMNYLFLGYTVKPLHVNN